MSYQCVSVSKLIKFIFVCVYILLFDYFVFQKVTCIYFSLVYSAGTVRIMPLFYVPVEGGKFYFAGKFSGSKITCNYFFLCCKLY